MPWAGAVPAPSADVLIFERCAKVTAAGNAARAVVPVGGNAARLATHFDLDATPIAVDLPIAIGGIAAEAEVAAAVDINIGVLPKQRRGGAFARQQRLRNSVRRQRGNTSERQLIETGAPLMTAPIVVSGPFILQQVALIAISALQRRDVFRPRRLQAATPRS